MYILSSHLIILFIYIYIIWLYADFNRIVQNIYNLIFFDYNFVKTNDVFPKVVSFETKLIKHIEKFLRFNLCSI